MPTFPRIPTMSCLASDGCWLATLPECERSGEELVTGMASESWLAAGFSLNFRRLFVDPIVHLGRSLQVYTSYAIAQT